MASDFVRNIKGVKNIDILSPNITTENDLISTTNGDVYVVTNKGYRKITNIETKDFEALKKQADTNTLNISDLTDDIDTLNTTTGTNTSDIDTLKTTTDTHTSDIADLKTTTDTHTSDIADLNTTTETNTSVIADLKTTTGNNTSEIETLKTTTDTNTSEIEALKTSTGNNTSEIETLKTSTSNNKTNIDSTQTLIEQLQTQLDELKSKTLSFYTLFEGSVKGVGTTIELNDDYTTYNMLFISGSFGAGEFTQEYSTSLSGKIIIIRQTNVSDTDGNGGGHHELIIEKINNNELKIINDVFYDFGSNEGSGADANRFTITKIEGVK